MRASIYVRISRDREGSGLGVAAQEADCREVAQSLGCTIVSVHTDNDLSAYSGKPRPGYKALLSEIESKSIDAVIAWHTDRLHRSMTELENYAAVCERSTVATHTVKAGLIDLTTPSGRLVARQLGSVARYEVEHSIERMKRAKLRSATAGKWKGGRRPFGYEADGVTLREAEAEAIASASTELLAGVSLRSLARRWNDRGLTTTTGAAWEPSAVARVLIRPRNAGRMEHNNRIIGEAEWPAIVPEDLWRAVTRTIKDPARRTSPGNGRRWLGSGIYTCGVCGGRMIVTMANQKRVYRCFAHGHVSRVAALVDEYVCAVVAARLRRPDIRALLAPKPADKETVRGYEAQIMTLRSRLEELAELFARGEVDARQLATATRRINEDIEERQARVADTYRGSTLQDIACADDPAELFASADLDRKRAILDAFASVKILKARRGRPPGWERGTTYFDHERIQITWRQQ